MVLRGKETINIDSIDELSYLRSKYEKNKKMNLICPSPKSFSDSIKNILSKRFKCKFSTMNNSEFNKICHNYEIILMRFNNIIKYKKDTKIKFILCPTTATEHIDDKFFKDKKNKNIYVKK